LINPSRATLSVLTPSLTIGEIKVISISASSLQTEEKTKSDIKQNFKKTIW